MRRVPVCLYDCAFFIVADGTVHSPVDPVYSHRPGKFIRLGCTSGQQKKEISDEFFHHAVSISRSDFMYLYRVFR